MLFVPSGTPVYEGMVVGEYSRDVDLDVNVCREKKLTNMRASGHDEAVRLVPHREMGLEDALAWIDDDELVEVTPETVRIRKRGLGARSAARGMRSNRAGGPAPRSRHGVSDVRVRPVPHDAVDVFTSVPPAATRSPSSSTPRTSTTPPCSASPRGRTCRRRRSCYRRLPPARRNRLRIFTPRSWLLAFAGHPTIGSAHAVSTAGVATPRDGVLRQECRAGVLPIARRRRCGSWCACPIATLAGAIGRRRATRSPARSGAPSRGAPVAIDLRPGLARRRRSRDEAALRARGAGSGDGRAALIAHGLTGVTRLRARRTRRDADRRPLVRAGARASRKIPCAAAATPRSRLPRRRRLDARRRAIARARAARSAATGGSTSMIGARDGTIEIGGAAVTVVDGLLTA